MSARSCEESCATATPERFQQQEPQQPRKPSHRKMRRLFVIRCAEIGRIRRKHRRKKGARRRLSRQPFYYDLLELVADTDDSRDLIRRRRRRQAVDCRYSLASRSRAAGGFIHAIDIYVRTLG